MSAKRRVIPVFVPHMGCPNECVFCNQRHISGFISEPDANTVSTALKAAGSKTPAELAFYGGSFTAIPEQIQNELLTAARPFLEQDPDNSIRISTRPDCINQKIVRHLKDCGVRTIELGAQSMCGDVLRLSRRGHTAEDVYSASGIIKDAGLSLILQMMTGLPGDTRESSVYTAERFIDINPDGVRIYPAVIVRDTELYDMWRRGEYREHSVTEAVTLCAELVVMFKDADIPIIRLGLNPTDELTGGTAAAGAYHPALGELVYSRVYLNKAEKLLRDIPSGSDVTIGVARKCMSIMVGQRRVNIEYLEQKFGLRSLKVTETDAEPDEIRIISR